MMQRVDWRKLRNPFPTSPSWPSNERERWLSLITKYNWDCCAKTWAWFDYYRDVSKGTLFHYKLLICHLALTHWSELKSQLFTARWIALRENDFVNEFSHHSSDLFAFVIKPWQVCSGVRGTNLANRCVIHCSKENALSGKKRMNNVMKQVSTWD